MPINAEEVEKLVTSVLEDCDVEVAGEGANYDIRVVGDLFTGKRQVQRQQLVYSALREQIASGDIHAVNIRALTPGEAAEDA
ncbi:MAG: BolA family protein [bacterium]